jgi:hypothetical protein
MITLKKLFIKNFKAFQEEQTIPLERITLIFGKNSAGKSTILHAVALLRQILQTDGKLNMDQLQLANKQLNLGTLDEVRFDHDPNNCPTLSVECKVTRPFGSLVPDNVLGSASIFENDDNEFLDMNQELSEPSDDDDLECSEQDFIDFTAEDGHHYSIEPRPVLKSYRLTSSSESVRDEIGQPPGLSKFKTGDLLHITWKLHDNFHILQITLNGETIASYNNIGLEDAENNQINSDQSPSQILYLAHPLVQRTRELLYRLAIRYGNVENIERSNEEKFHSRKIFYDFFNDWFNANQKINSHNPYVYMYSGKEKSRISVALEPALETFLKSDLAELRRTPFGAICRAAFYSYLDPNYPTGVQYDEVRKYMNEFFESFASDYLGWMASNFHFQILSAINNRLGSDYIPAHRPPPPRDVTRTRISEWITQGSSTLSWNHLFDGKILLKFNAWLDYIGVGITAVCRKLEIHDPDAARNPIAHDPQIVFTKPGRNLRSSHADLGYGVGQLVPILVAGSSSESLGIKIVEQPEAQVHPGLQAQMGDFFIGQSSNWLIETHSEHLILRILRRIRETPKESCATTDENDWDEVFGENQSPESGEPLAVPGDLHLLPSEVSVVYVEPGICGSRVTELPVTANGDFSCPWPEGFFEERFEEYE